MITGGFEFYTGRFEREYYKLEPKWRALFSEVGKEKNFLKEIVRKVKISRQFGELFHRYAEKGRFYHTPKHLLDCLREFNEAVDFIKSPHELEAAIWFHDAVYDTKAKDNEEKSAELAYKFCKQLQLPENFTDKVSKLVLATKHNFIPEDSESRFIIDIDLAIFGQPEKIFDEYEENIRKEYAWVKQEIYKIERVKILNRFLDKEYRKQVYLTDFFRNKYEQKARRNLERSIKKLSL